jgi:hypothetical protein
MKKEDIGSILFELVWDFIHENNITCAETIYQNDRVIERSGEFIENLCDVVGYVKEE